MLRTRETRTDYIISRPVSRLYFIKQLKKSWFAVMTFIALLYYSNQTYIIGLLEYVSPLWQRTLDQVSKLNVWRPFSVGLSILFFVIHRLSLTFLRWLWLAFHLSKQDAQIIPNVFPRNTCQPDNCGVDTIFTHRLDTQP